MGETEAGTESGGVRVYKSLRQNDRHLGENKKASLLGLFWGWWDGHWE